MGSETAVPAPSRAPFRSIFGPFGHALPLRLGLSGSAGRGGRAFVARPYQKWSEKGPNPAQARPSRSHAEGAPHAPRAPRSPEARWQGVPKTTENGAKSARGGCRNGSFRVRRLAGAQERLRLGVSGGAGGAGRASAWLRPGRAWAGFGRVAPGPLLVFVTGSETAVPALSARAFSLQFLVRLGTPCHCAWAFRRPAPLRGCGPAVPGLSLACRSRAPATLRNGFRNCRSGTLRARLFAPFLVLLGTPCHCAWAFRGARGARGARLCACGLAVPGLFGPVRLRNGFRNCRSPRAPFRSIFGTFGHALPLRLGARGGRLCVAAARPCLGWVWPGRSRAPASLCKGFQTLPFRHPPRALFAPFLVLLGTPCHCAWAFRGARGARLCLGQFGPVAPGPLLVFVTGSETAGPTFSKPHLSLLFP